MPNFKTKPILMEKPAITHSQRPWGEQWLYAHNIECTTSIARINPGQRLSLQIHSGRSELWVILDDGAVVQLGEETIYPKKGDQIWIPAGLKHRFGSNGPEVRFMEVGFGNWQQEDIVRLADDYARPKEGE
jgi:mannose-6-phosphate isomerase